MASKKPTAANILASLGVKGAIGMIPEGESPSSYAGFVPMLDEDGKLNIKFIPSLAVESAVAPLKNVVVVDPGSSASEETGSVIAPFKTIDAAARAAKTDASGRCAILLVPGRYPATNNSIAQFSNTPSEVFFLGVGECVLDATTFNVGGLAANGSVFFRDIMAESCVKIVNSGTVTCLGRTHFGRLELGAGSKLRLSSEARVDSTDAERVSYLSEASRIGNDSSVRGNTVKDALDRLGRRRMRVLNVTADSSGFSYDSSSYADVEAESSGQDDVYDLRRLEKVVIDGINRLVNKGKDIEAETVTAKTVKAEVVEADKLKMDAMVLGGYKLAIDPYGYLVVADGDTPIEPPSGVILISDSASSSYAVYAITVINGRLHLANADMVDDSGSSPGVVTELDITDSETGIEYTVRMEDGRLVLTGGGQRILIS